MLAVLPCYVRYLHCHNTVNSANSAGSTIAGGVAFFISGAIGNVSAEDLRACRPLVVTWNAAERSLRRREGMTHHPHPGKMEVAHDNREGNTRGTLSDKQHRKSGTATREQARRINHLTFNVVTTGCRFESCPVHHSFLGTYLSPLLPRKKPVQGLFQGLSSRNRFGSGGEVTPAQRPACIFLVLTRFRLDARHLNYLNYHHAFVFRH